MERHLQPLAHSEQVSYDLFFLMLFYSFHSTHTQSSYPHKNEFSQGCDSILCFCFKTRFHVTQTGLGFTACWRLTLNFWSSCLHPWSTWDTGVHHRSWVSHGARDWTQSLVHARQALCSTHRALRSLPTAEFSFFVSVCVFFSLLCECCYCCFYCTQHFIKSIWCNLDVLR